MSAHQGEFNDDEFNEPLFGESGGLPTFLIRVSATAAPCHVTVAARPCVVTLEGNSHA